MYYIDIILSVWFCVFILVLSYCIINKKNLIYEQKNKELRFYKKLK
jgi:hypothetical protein